MARRTVSIYRRSAKKKGQNHYYIRIWDEARGVYILDRSISSLIVELNLDTKKYSSTSKSSAILLGQELLRRGGLPTRQADILFSDYCSAFWDWDNSSYIQGKLARGLRIGKEYVKHNAAYIRNYIRPTFPAIRLSAVKTYQIENFILNLKKNTSLSNSSLNAIFEAIRIPLKEAHRLGLLPNNPVESVQKLGKGTAEKGIPTEDEVSEILKQPLDERIRCAILLSAGCALRLGEVQAVRIEKIDNHTLIVDSSWGKIDGLKETKTGKFRIVPLPIFIEDAVIKLAKSNPHGRNGYIIYGCSPKAPLDCRAIERGFDQALIRVTLGDRYQNATKEQKLGALADWKERNITFHSLRHFANAKLRGAVPDETLRKLTGHSTEAMTDRYDHTTASDLQALARAQEERILPFINKTA